MNAEEYIASGLLELYVAGALSDEERKEVEEAIRQHAVVAEEVIRIEKKSAQPPVTGKGRFILRSVGEKWNASAKTGNRGPFNWAAYAGWLAALLLAGGLLWSFGVADSLRNEIGREEEWKDTLQQTLIQSKEENTALQEENREIKRILSIIRNDQLVSVTLEGQKGFEKAYAKVYWDRAAEEVYLDLKGLPDPPAGQVYQLWSLQLAPQIPTNIGVIEKFRQNENKIFRLSNTNDSEAFGISLEPAGGSDSPTMEQLYVLGIVPND